MIWLTVYCEVLLTGADAADADAAPDPPPEGSGATVTGVGGGVTGTAGVCDVVMVCP